MTDWIKKMKIKKSRYKTEMGITLLENMFITQYLPYVSENELKVYIYGLKFASEGYCHFEDFDNKKFAEILGLTQEEVEDAWNYWIDKKLINRKNEDGNRNLVCADTNFTRSKVLHRIFTRKSKEMLSHHATRRQ